MNNDYDILTRFSKCLIDNLNGTFTLRTSGAGSGSSTFIGLTDVPASYTGQGLKVVSVNAGETALVFTTLAGGGDALTANPLSQFAATTSLQLKGVISDETGSGALVFANTPTLVTPVIGAATGTSLQLSGLTASEILGTDGSKNIVSLAVATYPSLTELTYVKGVTSAIQTQMNLKSPLASPTFTGTVVIPTPFTLGAVSVLPTGTELNFVDGVTSSIQTQLDAKSPSASPTFTGTVTIPTPFTLGAVSVLPTGTELNYVDGVTSAIQTQLDAKAPLASPTFTGTVTLPVVTAGGVITLSENSALALDPAGSADGKYTGITMVVTAGETIAFGEIVYLKAADSQWYLTDADADATAGAVFIAIAVTSGTDNNTMTVMTYGMIRADAKFPALTVGAPVYISTTPGAVQVAQPSGTDDIIRIVGHAATADELFFNPNTDWISHT